MQAGLADDPGHVETEELGRHRLGQGACKHTRSWLTGRDGVKLVCGSDGDAH